MRVCSSKDIYVYSEKELLVSFFVSSFTTARNLNFARTRQGYCLRKICISCLGFDQWRGQRKYLHNVMHYKQLYLINKLKMCVFYYRWLRTGPGFGHFDSRTINRITKKEQHVAKFQILPLKIYIYRLYMPACCYLYFKG